MSFLLNANSGNLKVCSNYRKPEVINIRIIGCVFRKNDRKFIIFLLEKDYQTDKVQAQKTEL